MAKKLRILVAISLVLTVSGVFAQRISETAFEPGANKTSSPEFRGRWNDSGAPAFLFLNVSRSWYNEDHRVSLRKGLGLKVQYAPIDLGGGGLGGGSHITGHIYSLFVNPELLAHVKIRQQLAVELGPAFEYLIIGSNRLNDSWWRMDLGSGNSKISGTNRDYLNKPAYGLRLRLLDTAPESKISAGLTFSYLRTKSEESNFYAKNYFQVSFLIGLRKSKGTTIELDQEEKQDPGPN
jgi:hypothetical protein